MKYFILSIILLSALASNWSGGGILCQIHLARLKLLSDSQATKWPKALSLGGNK